MMRPGHPFLLRAVICLIFFFPAIPAQAKDYGIFGPTWPIAEKDFLTVIESQLNQLEADGEIDSLNQQMAEKGKAYIHTPPSVTGLSETVEPRSWLHDPSIVVERDIKDHKGRIIAAKGTRINPLDRLPSLPDLVFINGKSDSQIEWALSRSEDQSQPTKIILVNGSPTALMTKHKRRFFFDQRGLLVRHFGIQAVPAEIKKEHNRLRITEIAP